MLRRYDPHYGIRYPIVNPNYRLTRAMNPAELAKQGVVEYDLPT